MMRKRMRKIPKTKRMIRLEMVQNEKRYKTELQIVYSKTTHQHPSFIFARNVVGMKNKSLS